MNIYFRDFQVFWLYGCCRWLVNRAPALKRVNFSAVFDSEEELDDMCGLVESHLPMLVDCLSSHGNALTIAVHRKLLSHPSTRKDLPMLADYMFTVPTRQCTHNYGPP